MRLLILGGTSWLGGELARQGVAGGADVTCLARGESGAVPPEVTFVQADRTAVDAYASVAGRDWDLVVDASRQPGQARSAVDSLGGTADRWVLVSSGSVYADQSVPLTEDSPLLPAATTDEVTPEEYGEGKVACEQAVRGHQSALIARVGLIGGPGDPFDRAAHYAARHALADDGPVLVPDVAEQPMSVLDVRDLAGWLLDATAVGVVHAVGDPTTVGALLDASREAAGASGEQVRVQPDRLREAGVQEWMGERSLPLWLPPDHVGLGAMDADRSRAAGLRPRPIADTLADALDDERRRGLGRPRRAGLTRDDELALLARLS